MFAYAPHTLSILRDYNIFPKKETLGKAVGLLPVKFSAGFMHNLLAKDGEDDHKQRHHR